MTEKWKAPSRTRKPDVSGDSKGKTTGGPDQAAAMILDRFAGGLFSIVRGPDQAAARILDLIESGAKEIAEAVVSAVKAGDLTVAQMVLGRAVPPSKERVLHAMVDDKRVSDERLQLNDDLSEIAKRSPVA